MRHSISTGDSICILALGSGARLLYPSNRVRTANPVLVRVRGCTDTSAPRHFGTGGTDHRGSHACQQRQLRSGRGGELKAVDVTVMV